MCLNLNFKFFGVFSFFGGLRFRVDVKKLMTDLLSYCLICLINFMCMLWCLNFLLGIGVMCILFMIVCFVENSGRCLCVVFCLFFMFIIGWVFLVSCVRLMVYILLKLRNDMVLCVCELFGLF